MLYYVYINKPIICCFFFQVGNVFYRSLKRKKDKKVEVRKSIRQDIRRIARLYLTMKKSTIVEIHHNSRDVFLQQNFSSMRDALDECSHNGKKFKAGLKQNFLYLLKRVAKVLICLDLEKFDKKGSEEISYFLKLLELWEDFIFGDAVYQSNKNREVKLRRPHNLPLEEDVIKIRNEILKRLSEETPLNLFNENSFVQLREAVCSRLTLLNGRRGGEPSRTFLDQWIDAKKDGCIDQQRAQELDDFDQLLLKN